MSSHLLFGLCARRAAGQLAARAQAKSRPDPRRCRTTTTATGSSPARARCAASRRLASEDAVVEDRSGVDRRPRLAASPRRVVAPRAIGAAFKQRRRRDARRAPQRCAVAATSLAQHRRRRPTSARLGCDRLVVGVDDDRARDARYRRERGAAGADDDRPARAHAVPLVLARRRRRSLAARDDREVDRPTTRSAPAPTATPPRPRRLVGAEDQSQRVGRRGDSMHPGFVGHGPSADAGAERPRHGHHGQRSVISRLGDVETRSRDTGLYHRSLAHAQEIEQRAPVARSPAISSSGLRSRSDRHAPRRPSREPSDR